MNSSLHKTQHVEQKAKVLGGNGKSGIVSERIPAYMAGMQSHRPTFVTHTFNGVPTGLFSTSGGKKYSSFIDKGLVPKLKGMTMKIEITVASNPVRLAPVPYWFDRLRMLSKGGSQELYSKVNDGILLDIVCQLPKDKEKQVLKGLNMGYEEGQEYWEGPYLQVGVHTFYLPIHGPWSNSDGLWFQNFASDIQVEVDGASSIIADGAGTVTCTALHMILESEHLSEVDAIYHDKEYTRNAYSSHFLHPVRVTSTSETITASTEKTIDLSSVSGKIAGLILMIRSSTSNTSNGNYNFVGLGDPDQNCTIDLKDPANKSLVGAGSPVDVNYLKNMIYPMHFDNDFFNKKNVYLLPFCESLKHAYAGKVNGFWQADGSASKVAFTPSAAGTKSVVTLTLATGTNDDGSVTLDFKGSRTSQLDWEANQATVDGALDALPSSINFKGRRHDWTLSAANFSATRTLTLNPEASLDSEKELVTLSGGINDGGVGGVFTSSLSTAGKSGFATGSYTVDVIALVHKKFSVYNGKVSVQDL